jgi:hypothetical protein
LKICVQRIIAAPANERRGTAVEKFSSHEHRNADKPPQALTRVIRYFPGKASADRSA